LGLWGKAERSEGSVGYHHPGSSPRVAHRAII